jgi:hypothetical protein
MAINRASRVRSVEMHQEQVVLIPGRLCFRGMDPSFEEVVGWRSSCVTRLTV